MFDPNSGFMYAIVTIVVAFVIIESVYFIIRAWRQARKLGIDGAVLRKTVTSSAIFTIAPAVAILIGVITLSKALGYPLPWLRLSVIGALTYELPAAETAAQTVGASLDTLVTDPKVFTTIAWVMTVGIIPGLILVPAFGKKIESGLDRIKSRDEKWGQIFMDCLFLGMISAFLGYIFADIRGGLVGWIPVFVMLTSAVIMIVLGTIYKKFKIRWMQDYALPISLLGAMALSIPITNLISSVA